jgi:hypothetical protein
MTDRGVPDGEMFRWQTRPEFRSLDALLSGSPEDAPAGLRPVAEVLAALQAPPDPGEFAGWNRALTAFRQAPGLPELSPRPRSRRPGSRLGAKLAAAAAAAAAAALGGGIAAAYTGMLPAALQRIAHSTIAAPAPVPAAGVRPARPAATTTGRPEGPDGTGSAAYGLCTAYQHAEASQRAAAFRKLVIAAGGEAKVAAYCGWGPNPGATATPGDGRSNSPAVPSATHPSHGGKPTVTPSHGSTVTPGQKPTAVPSHKPTATPSHGKSHDEPQF